MEIVRTPAVDKLFEELDIVYSPDRDARVKESGEIFTPYELIEKMLSELDYDFQNHDHTKTWLDPTMGTANFLVMLAALGVRPENLYGVDLMDDNVQKSKERLKEIHLGNGVLESEIDYHQGRNIVQGDALTYDYNFWKTDELLEEW